jgi:LacI family sucrose operon transcriptional repressor
MKVTIAEVAKLAGVAKSTVSRYLNGGYVSDELRQKIDKVVKETKYEPNTFARSLKAKRTKLIGVIIPRINSHSVSLILKGIDEQLREAGYQMLIANTNQNMKREIESFHGFENQNVAGIIWISGTITEQHIKMINKIKIPILSVGQIHDEVASLGYDDEGAGYCLGEYIVSQGHKKIIYVGVTENDLAVGIKRKKGFLTATTVESNCSVVLYESTFLMKDAYELAKHMRLEKETVIVCATDNIALGVMKAMNERRVKIPDDISMAGFGDYEIADMVGLTTVYYPYQEAGQLAGEKILKSDLTPMKALNCQIKIRESVDKLN